MFEKVFNEYQNVYLGILDNFYPSVGSTGFQERNLTVNFSKAYEKVINGNAISWFELQFGEKNNLHLDCVIIDKINKRIFLIEAKRYSAPKRKKASVTADIERIEGFIKDSFLQDERFQNYQDYQLFGVILGDVWFKESKSKEALHQSYLDKNYFPKRKRLKNITLSI